MKKVADFFEEELKKTVRDVLSVKGDSDIAFSLVTDSHLSDNGKNTCQNIAAVDDAVGFDAVLHMGDLLCGNIPEKASRKLLAEEISMYRNAVKTGRLLISQGNHDGYRDESYLGQLVCDMALDENWYEDTKFIDSFENVSRPGKKPYFYLDYPEQELRLIFLCSETYMIDKEKKEFRKSFELTDEQFSWFANDALNTPRGYTVMVFSHIPPFEWDKNEAGEKVFCYREKQTNYENSVKVLRAYNEGEKIEIDGTVYDYTGNDGRVAAWFFGHDHCDFYKFFDGIHFVCVTSETAYIPQLWEAYGEYPGPRNMGTVSEDAWDAMVWKKDEEKIYLFRFGAGEDRVIDYKKK